MCFNKLLLLLFYCGVLYFQFDLVSHFGKCIILDLALSGMKGLIPGLHATASWLNSISLFTHYNLIIRITFPFPLPPSFLGFSILSVCNFGKSISFGLVNKARLGWVSHVPCLNYASSYVSILQDSNCMNLVINSIIFGD